MAEKDRKALSNAPEYTGEEQGPEPPEEPTAARDGEPDENVVSLRQRIDEEKAKMTEGGDGIQDRAGNGEGATEEEDDGQFTFIVEESGKQIRFADLVKRGTPVEYQYKLTGKAIPNVKGGLIDPYETSHLVIADCVVDSVLPQYIRDGQGRVEKVVLYVTLKPRQIQQAFTEAGKVMLQEAAKAQAAA